jgi:hypothetical protein
MRQPDTLISASVATGESQRFLTLTDQEWQAFLDDLQRAQAMGGSVETRIVAETTRWTSCALV